MKYFLLPCLALLIIVKTLIYFLINLFLVIIILFKLNLHQPELLNDKLRKILKQ